MPLTTPQINALLAKAAKGKLAKPTRLAGDNRLFLLVEPSGSAAWKYQYTSPVTGKRRTLSHGPYPEVSLAQANALQSEARAAIRSRIDPLEDRSAVESTAPTFKVVALAWHTMKSSSQGRRPWKPSHAAAILKRLEDDLFVSLGDTPIDAISIGQMEKAILAIQARPAFDLAERARTRAVSIFRFGKTKKYCSDNPAEDIADILPAGPTEKHHPAPVQEKDFQLLGTMLADFDRYNGRVTTRFALRLAPLLGVRPGELRRAQWAEFDLETATWEVQPAEGKKIKAVHIVPLSRQALKLLRELKQINAGQYLFPNDKKRSTGDPFMSENTVNAAIKRLGYQGVMVGHGVRTILSTLANEAVDANDKRLWSADAIEKQLAHGEGDKVRGAYSRAANLKERRALMQWLADEFDRLKLAAVSG